jgi:hypothetical protein
VLPQPTSIHADNIRKYKNEKRLYGAILHGLEIGWASGFEDPD